MAPTPRYVVSETGKRKNLYSTLESSSSDEDAKRQILNRLKLRSRPKKMYSYLDKTDSDSSMNGFEDENTNSPQPGPSSTVRINLRKLRDPQALYENSF